MFRTFRFRAFLPASLALALMALATAPSAEAQTAYALGDGGTSLVRFSVDSPGSAERVGLFGGDGFFLDSIDFRPATGELFGYHDATNSYFTVDLATANLTSAGVATGGGTTNSPVLSIDWNPTIDRMRVVTDTRQNRVYNPETGTAAGFTDLFYGPGDQFEGFTPFVVGNAYTNSPLGGSMGETTVQYVIDHEWNVLSTLANNEGTLSSIGQVTLDGTALDFNEFAGFDIFTTLDGRDIAYALLTVDGMAGLYTIDLMTGAATSLGLFGADVQGGLYGLAVVPVPEPSSIALIGLGLAGLGAAVARRRRKDAGRLA